MAQGISTRCIPNIPYKEWAINGGAQSNGEWDRQNWLYLEQFIQQMLANCIEGGSCEPMAGRCHVTLGCGGFEYYSDASAGDYQLGGTSVGAATGLLLPAPGVWHVGMNMTGSSSPGSHMGQGLLVVTNSDTNDYDYGITVGNEDDTVVNHVTANGAVDHMVPPAMTARVSVNSTGTSGLVFLSGFIGIIYAHRIECTADLAVTYP